jgi:hypothetical protein
MEKRLEGIESSTYKGKKNLLLPNKFNIKNRKFSTYNVSIYVKRKFKKIMNEMLRTFIWNVNVFLYLYSNVYLRSRMNNLNYSINKNVLNFYVTVFCDIYAAV